MKIIDRHYRNKYNAIFNNVLRECSLGYHDETALPSYAHSNKLISWFFWYRINTVFSLLNDIRGKTVLDFGCGGGVTFKYLHDRDCHISGCDTFSYDLAERICKELGITADIYRDISDIKGRKFDVIFALDVLEHVQDLEELLDNILLLCHKDTKIILSGPTENFLYQIGRAIAGFKGADYHLTNIYHIEEHFRRKNLERITLRRLPFLITLFRISVWQLNLPNIS